MIQSETHVPWRGILAGVGAAVFYTLANVFLRKLATETEFVVVVFMKALTTACIFVPWLVFIASQGIRTLPRGKYLWIMLFASIQTQIIGNCGHQISLGVIGLAIGVPIYMGSLVASSALLGRLVLKERVKPLVAVSLAVLILSVILLSLGGKVAGQSLQLEQQSSLAGLPYIVGVMAAVGVGIAFAILGVCIRYVLRSGVPAQTPLVFVSVSGTAIFGTVLLLRDGLEVFNQHETVSWLMMLGAGLCNAIAFYCLSWSLKLLPVIYVNAINVSQVAMAGAIGVCLFFEPLSVWLSTGLVIMIIGFGMLAHFSSKTAVRRNSLNAPMEMDACKAK